MSLAPSARLGPYEILARLGAGGMGEVYRARDTRLGRDVAIKILPADLSGDPSRRARFEQEARALAALNHPNILGLYDIGTEDGIDYMVTEFVAGETLAALIERGPIPTRKLLDIAVQIADGMAAAHTARITHRDLKPLNIMIDRDTRVKILDFGLAKQAAPASTAPDETVTAAQTQPGTILGTVNYMSPEQVRGQPTDHRSDQFSFGLVLYEMGAGRKPFDRPDSVQTMSAILTDEPPIDRSIPAPLRWAIDRCLAKDPAGRYESSRDLFHELRSLRDHLSETSTSQAAMAAPAVVAAAPPRSRPIPWTLAAAFALGVAATFAALWMMAGPEIPDQSAYRFMPLSFEPGGQASLIWSPDSKSVAYAAREVVGAGVREDAGGGDEPAAGLWRRDRDPMVRHDSDRAVGGCGGRGVCGEVVPRRVSRRGEGAGAPGGASERHPVEARDPGDGRESGDADGPGGPPLESDTAAGSA